MSSYIVQGATIKLVFRLLIYYEQGLLVNSTHLHIVVEMLAGRPFNRVEASSIVAPCNL